MTPKQAAFVAEYVKDGNATQAAIRAGYSEHTSGSIAFENLQKPEIIAALEAARASAQVRVAERTAEAAITAERILERAWAIANETDEDGKPARDRVPALAIAAKAFPLFRDQVVDQSQHLNLNGLSQEQLDAAIERLSGPKSDG